MAMPWGQESIISGFLCDKLSKGPTVTHKVSETNSSFLVK